MNTLKKEIKEDIVIIKKARDSANLSNRETGFKFVGWGLLAILVYNAYSYTPLKWKINDLTNEEIFQVKEEV